MAARLGNWSASLGQVERWWGPGWDGSLVLSTNARPIPAIAVDRRIPEPFNTKWVGSGHGVFIHSSDKWKMSEIRQLIIQTTIFGECVGKLTNHPKWSGAGFSNFATGGDGRDVRFKSFIDAFLSQDNYGANTGRTDRSKNLVIS